MNPNTDFAAVLEQALGTLSNRTTSAAELKVAAEEACGVVRAIDEAHEQAPSRESQILAAMTGGVSIAATIAALGELDEESVRRMLMRKVATHLGAVIDGQSHDAEKIEKARDEARRPFAAQTRRVQELAAAFATYPTHAARIVSLFRSDALIGRFGSEAYSRVPVLGSHISFERTIRLPRMLATPERLTATRLLGYWPPKYSDFSGLEFGLLP